MTKLHPAEVQKLWWLLS